MPPPTTWPDASCSLPSSSSNFWRMFETWRTVASPRTLVRVLTEHQPPSIGARRSIRNEPTSMIAREQIFQLKHALCPSSSRLNGLLSIAIDVAAFLAIPEPEHYL